MANLKSSKKDIRRISKKRAANHQTRAALKTYVKSVRTAISEGDSDKIKAALIAAQKKIDKAAQRGIIHKNQAARRKARIATQVAAALKG